VIEIYKCITDNLGDLDFWLRLEIKNAIEDRVHEATGILPELEVENGQDMYYLPDTELVRFWIPHAMAQAVTNSRRVEPFWDSYPAKLKILRPLKIGKEGRTALKKACDLQTLPYRQRALVWLAQTVEIRDPYLQSLKAQLVRWDETRKAGKKTFENPLSEKQITSLCKTLFKNFPEWLAPTEEGCEEFVEVEQFDPWTGETKLVRVPRAKAEMAERQREYYRRVRP
jgi:hypothetical protein